MQQFRDVTWMVSVIYLSGLFILWAASIILTIADGKNTHPFSGFKWTKIGIVAAFLTTLLSFFLIGYTLKASVATLGYNGVPVEDASEEVSYRQLSHNFYEYIYFGGSPSGSHKLPQPPEGQGVLSGRIIYENRPAEAVLLHMVLNSKYRATNIITDSQGVFAVKLPVGDWYINSIQTESWQNKPDGNEFSIYYGGEAKLNGNSFNRHNRLQSSGFRITAGESKDKTHINLVIKKDIELVWPDQNVLGVEASILGYHSLETIPSRCKVLY